MRKIVDYCSYCYKDAKSFLKAITYDGELYKLFGDGFIFRGHSKQSYKLVPSSLREGKLNEYLSNWRSNDSILDRSEFLQILGEHELLHRFYEGCDESALNIPFSSDINFDFKVCRNITFPVFDEWLPSSMYRLAALAQHYGVPTRLLDWTRDINVAIYFSLTDYLKGSKPEENDHLEIWALNAHLIEKERNRLPLKIIKPPYRENPNLSAQKGIFTLWTIYKDTIIPPSIQKGNEKVIVVDTKFAVDSRPLDMLLTDYFQKNKESCLGTYLYKIQIPIDIPTLYDYISKMRSNARYLFPGYSGICREMKENRAVENIRSGLCAIKTLPRSSNYGDNEDVGDRACRPGGDFQTKMNKNIGERNEEV